MSRLFHPSLWFHPLTRKRLKRFREFRRAHLSFWILVVLYGLSLVSEFIANDKPLLVRFNGRWYAPVVRYYTDDEFTGSGNKTPPNYKAIAASDAFRTNASNRMWWPPIPYGPYEILRASDVPMPETVSVTFDPLPRVASVRVDSSNRVVEAWGDVEFFASGRPVGAGDPAGSFGAWPDAVREGLLRRFGNRADDAVEPPPAAAGAPSVSLAPFRPRPAAPDSAIVTLREQPAEGVKREVVRIARDGTAAAGETNFWNGLDASVRTQLAARAVARFTKAAEPMDVMSGGVRFAADFAYEDFRSPYKPVAGHWMGLDESGRDVLVRILYGMRISVSFGLLLVVTTMFIGTLIGAMQGYYGGWVDLGGQRVIEIWQAMPFLYVIIFLGSIYGQSLALLFIVYAIFNWIGISYYMRAEFLRLRHLPFVESARIMALPTRRILFKHILPNALVPIITFFPFSLVGAIGTLTALDYLGFGLPPPSPSWGELLKQALKHSWAWWLVLYPSLALFAVMLLCVFIGEGVRAAFDPRRYSRME